MGYWNRIFTGASYEDAVKVATEVENVVSKKVSTKSQSAANISAISLHQELLTTEIETLKGRVNELTVSNSSQEKQAQGGYGFVSFRPRLLLGILSDTINNDLMSSIEEFIYNLIRQEEEEASQTTWNDLDPPSPNENQEGTPRTEGGRPTVLLVIPQGTTLIVRVTGATAANQREGNPSVVLSVTK